MLETLPDATEAMARRVKLRDVVHKLSYASGNSTTHVLHAPDPSVQHVDICAKMLHQSKISNLKSSVYHYF